MLASRVERRGARARASAFGRALEGQGREGRTGQGRTGREGTVLDVLWDCWLCARVSALCLFYCLLFFDRVRFSLLA